MKIVGITFGIENKAFLHLENEKGKMSTSEIMYSVAIEIINSNTPKEITMAGQFKIYHF